MRLAKAMTGNGEKWVIIKGEKAFALEGTPFDGIKETNEEIDMSTAKLLAPCRPTKIVCVGWNYRDHAAEFGEQPPENPTIFIKPVSALLNPGERIIYPDASERVDYECELALVIRKRAYKVKAENAREYILGYTCLNDVTARDLQARDGQWTRAKGFDTFCPVGPVVTDEVDPSRGLVIETRLNGEVKQSSRTDRLMWDVPFLIEYITDCMTLMPGDVVSTGTPANVGPMRRGDTVAVYIEGIGELVNTI